MKLISLHKLFDIKYGTNLELVNLEQCERSDDNSIAFVSRTGKNNGVSAFVKRIDDIEENPAGSISVAGGGSILASFYHESIYYSGRDIYVLIPKVKLSVLEMLFYAYCITKNKYRYSYGRQANKTLKDIMLPKQIPSEFADINLDNLNTINPEKLLSKDLELNQENWQSFNLEDTFRIIGSKTTSLQELEEYGVGKYPYITTQATNNGVEGFYDYHTEEGNILTVDSAVLGYSSYQPLNFSASDHVEKLIPKFAMNKYIAMFLVTILNLEKYRYNYGRKCSQARMKQISIKLPAKNGVPDFEFMENYIKSLPYSASI